MRTSKLLVSYSIALILSGCSTYKPDLVAFATLKSTQGNTAKGAVSFTQMDDKVIVAGEITGLAPNTIHGFHIHEKGDCSTPDAMSAGAHFNPEGHNHGAFDQADHHAGDLPSLTSDSNGVARIFYEASSISVGGAKNNIIDRGLIIHRDADNPLVQPHGSAGPRIACAPITKSFFESN
jgi:Cu-Zn family superoxide dismutase